MTHAVRKPDGGFVFIPASMLIAAWWLYKRRLIELKDLRLWLAAHELTASRCSLKEGRVPDYRMEEFARLIGSGCRPVASVARLERVGLITWSRSRVSFATRLSDIQAQDHDLLTASVQAVQNHKRRVPVPRRILRHLARTTRPASIATVFGHLLRCMYYRDGGCSPVGLCKAAWIAEHFGMHVRNIKHARRELEAAGMLLRQETPQWLLNRWGLRVEINLAWEPPGFVKRRKSPPRERVIRTQSPPPESNRELSSKEETKNAAPPLRSGFFETKKGTGVDWRNVHAQNLSDDQALLTLYEQATSQAILPRCESTRLQFFAAAEHARRCGQSNPPGLFVAVVRRRLWHHITQAEEDAARNRLRRHAFSHVSSRPAPAARSRSPVPSTSDAERLRIRREIERSLREAAAA